MSYKDYVGISKETAWGTKNTGAPTFQPPVTSMSVNLQREILQLDETTGVRGPSAIAYGTGMISGTVEGALRPGSAGLLLAGNMGAPTSASLGGSPTAYGHTYDNAAATALVPLSLWQINGDISNETRLYYGCYVDALTISAAVDEYLLFKADVIGKGVDEGQSAPTAGRETASRWTALQVTATMGTAGGSLTTVKLRDFSVTTRNGVLTDDFILGSSEVQSLPLGNLECDVEFTVAENYATHWERATAASPTSYALTLTATGATISGANAYSLVYNVKSFEYTEAPVEIDAGDTLRAVKVTGHGSLDASSDLVTAVLTNVTASY